MQPRRVETDVSLSYLHTNQALGLGNDKVLQFIAAGRYGIVAGLEGFLQVPLLWGQRQINEFQSQVSNELDGLGDIRFGLKYSAINERPWVPNVVLGVSASAPTGKAPYLARPPQISRRPHLEQARPARRCRWEIREIRSTSRSAPAIGLSRDRRPR